MHKTLRVGLCGLLLLLLLLLPLLLLLLLPTFPTFLQESSRCGAQQARHGSADLRKLADFSLCWFK